MSAIPGALDSLVSLFDTALIIKVSDGPTIVDFEQDGLAVGWVPEQIAVPSSESDSSMGDRGESFDVHNYLWARTGDEQVKPVRDRLFGYVDQIKATLKANNRLDGAVTRAVLAKVDYDQGQTSEGAWAAAMLTIHCEAL